MRLSYLLLVCPLYAWAQSASPAGTPARIVITLGHHYGREPAVLTRDDMIFALRSEPLPVTNLVALKGDRAALELFLLIDNCSSCEFGSKLDDLRRFVASQASATAVGVAYIQDGRLKVVEGPTRDRERVIQALSAPAGSKPSSPFTALAELIQGWKQSAARRAVLVISNGINPAAKGEPLDPSAEAAIDAAQRTGVTVYAIYHPSADYENQSYSEGYSGQIHLAHVAYETGGEAYFVYVGPLASLAPFLADIADHLANQYLLEFLVKPAVTPGAFQDITVKPKSHDLELMAPGRVWISVSGVTELKPGVVSGKR